MQADEGLFGQVKSNATAVAGDSAKKSQFEKLRDASYSGPQSLQDIDQGNAWAGIQSKLQTARNAKNQAGTEEGRMGLIKEISNNPRQSQGALTFDNLLLQSNPNAASMLQNAGSSLNDFDARLASKNEEAGARAKAVKEGNAQVAQSAKGAVNEGFDSLFGARAGADKQYGTADDEDLGIQSSLKGREASTKAAQEAAYKDFQKRLNTGNLSSQDLAELGLSPDSKTYNAMLSKYLSQNVDANIKNVANEDDYARQAALAELMGGSGAPSILNPTTDKNLIGTAGKGYSYNQGGLSEQISANKRDFQNEYAQAFGDKSPQLQGVIDWLFAGGPRPAGWANGIEDDEAAKADILGKPSNGWMKDVGAVMQKYGVGNVPGKSNIQGQLKGPQGSALKVKK